MWLATGPIHKSRAILPGIEVKIRALVPAPSLFG